MRRIIISLIALIFSLSLGFSQENKLSQKGEEFLAIRPLGLFNGLNLSYERSLSNKLAWETSINSQHWLLGSFLPNIAIYQNLKYSFYGDNRQGFYTKGLLFLGSFYKDTPLNNNLSFAGAGILVGGTIDILNKKREPTRFSLFIETGLKIPFSFNKKEGRSESDHFFGLAYATIISNASLIEFSIGLRYRL